MPARPAPFVTSQHTFRFSIPISGSSLTAASERRCWKKYAVFLPLRSEVPTTGHVRVLYASPNDREFRADYSRGIQNAVLNFKSWLRRELRGQTFSLYSITPEHCQLREDSDFYSRGDAWDKVVNGCTALCAGE